MKDKLKRTNFQLIEAFIKAEGDRILEKWDILSSGRHTGDDDAMIAKLNHELETRFCELRKEHFPEDGYLGESCPNIPSQNGYEWHVDPIDGVKNLKNGIPLWCITASLTNDSAPVYGIIYNPVTRQLYTATKDAGAFLNGQRLHALLSSKPDTEQLAIDFFMQQKSPLERRTQEALLGQLFDSFYRVRSIGNGSLSLSWLAQGHFSAYLSWGITKERFADLAAGLVIAEEAGATVEMMKLNNNRTAIIVGNPWTLEQLAKLIDESEDVSYSMPADSRFTAL